MRLLDWQSHMTVYLLPGLPAHSSNQWPLASDGKVLSLYVVRAIKYGVA